MKKYQGLSAETSLQEEPGKNHYVVKFGDHPQEDPAAVVDVYVDTLTYQVTKAYVGTIYPEQLRGVSEEALLKAAEIEINTLPGLPMYTLIPGAHPREETSVMPT